MDVYSFGVVLWEIVTREMPMRGRLRDVMVPSECPQVRHTMTTLAIHRGVAVVSPFCTAAVILPTIRCVFKSVL